MSEQTADQIVRWAERQEDTKKPQGKAAHLSPEQKQAIRVAYLETGGNVTYADMGRRCASIIGREVNRETVATCLKGPEYDKLRKHFDTEIKAGAIERLKAGILPAADAWVKAVDVAADKGDHKPAKELLMHTGTIEPLDDHGRAQGPLVLVYVGNSKTPIEPPQPFVEGAVIEDTPLGLPEPESRPYGVTMPDGTHRRLTLEERDEVTAKHKGMVIQIGIPDSDVDIKLSDGPAQSV